MLPVMSPRLLRPDGSPVTPLTDEWRESDRFTPDSRIAIRRYLMDLDPFNDGWDGINAEDLYTFQALELLLELREQLEHEIDRWVIYGLENGVPLRQIADPLALTRQGLSKRLDRRGPDGYW